MDTAEVEDLYRFARERSAEGRAALTTAVANLFQDRGDRLTDRERTLIFRAPLKILLFRASSI